MQLAKGHLTIKVVGVYWETSLELAIAQFRVNNSACDRGRLIWVTTVSELWRERCRRIYVGEYLAATQLRKKLQTLLSLLRNGYPHIVVII
ncbi:unnamed protein product [Linum trigynum]|uniref:Uncharacterized protein n=1 Tax=Linum trigynum TaxID=586398 RepID=A0AAV2EBP4_9ROSI